VRSSHPNDGAARVGFLPGGEGEADASPPPIAAVYTIEALLPARRAGSGTLWLLTGLILLAVHGIWRATHRTAAPAATVASTFEIHEERPTPAPQPAAAAAAEPAPHLLPVARQPIARREAHEESAPHVDAEAAKARELKDVRASVARQLGYARDLVAAQSFDAAEEALERVGADVQRFADDLAQEREELRALRKQLVDGRVRVQTAMVQDELRQAEWSRSLSAIEAQIGKGSFPEALALADALIADSRAPAEVVERARELRKRATAGLKAIFGETKAGPATSTIRKPSSPPRN
jgi:hypothetical protein